MKIQEKSSKLNDSVKSYNKKTNREEGAIPIADLVTFTEEIFNGKLYFLYSVDDININQIKIYNV